MNNIKEKMKTKSFWLAMIPAILLLAQEVLKLFGIAFQTDSLQKELLDILNTIFVILTVSGIVISHDETSE
ncbi:phage holin [Vagococcus entomophilus]|uniref:Holin n=1 Tax=Vagococcus entomophilus TaxID=1160095 RepID=A0A430AKB5_9ENTE|nr:phage holin [Vagococcus entomophilus]RSU08424.1 hypothetical protein CBF30_04075 [Vagococcus entomophilus]